MLDAGKSNRFRCEVFSAVRLVSCLSCCVSRVQATTFQLDQCARRTRDTPLKTQLGSSEQETLWKNKNSKMLNTTRSSVNSSKTQTHTHTHTKTHTHTHKKRRAYTLETCIKTKKTQLLYLLSNLNSDCDHSFFVCVCLCLCMCVCFNPPTQKKKKKKSVSTCWK